MACWTVVLLCSVEVVMDCPSSSKLNDVAGGTVSASVVGFSDRGTCRSRCPGGVGHTSSAAKAVTSCPHQGNRDSRPNVPTGFGVRSLPRVPVLPSVTICVCDQNIKNCLLLFVPKAVDSYVCLLRDPCQLVRPWRLVPSVCPDLCG